MGEIQHPQESVNHGFELDGQPIENEAAVINQPINTGFCPFANGYFFFR
jgi:hypothetical protein